MQRSSGRPWFGIGLIAVGAALLLHQFHMLPISWHDVWWGAIFVLGCYLIAKAFVTKGKGMVAGVLAAGIGGYNILTEYTSLYIPHYLVLPSLLILVGVGILLVYFTALSKWHLLVPSLLLIGLGTLIIYSEQGYLDRWELIDFIRTWWPAALVLFGAAMLVNQLRQNRRESTNQSKDQLTIDSGQ